MKSAVPLLAIVALSISSQASAQAQGPSTARQAAIHPVSTVAEMEQWLARVPATRQFPPDFTATLQWQAPPFFSSRCPRLQVAFLVGTSGRG
jgi:hypothetical protein